VLGVGVGEEEQRAESSRKRGQAEVGEMRRCNAVLLRPATSKQASRQAVRDEIIVRQKRGQAELGLLYCSSLSRRSRVQSSKTKVEWRSKLRM